MSILDILEPCHWEYFEEKDKGREIEGYRCIEKIERVIEEMYTKKIQRGSERQRIRQRNGKQEKDKETDTYKRTKEKYRYRIEGQFGVDPHGFGPPLYIL